ncbi:helicase-associated domain-containing protein [Planctomycetota bacterium]|nr:helicase-associated domain-containing protein [Planctomycetota bacterium]
MSKTTTNGVSGYIAGEMDLLSVLETVSDRNPKLLKSGAPNLAFFRAANRVLLTPDSEQDSDRFYQVEFWLAISFELGLIEINDHKLSLSRAADEFFEQDWSDRLHAAQDAWLQSRDINEIALTPTLELPGLKKGRTVDATSDAPLPEVRISSRRAVLEALDQATSIGALCKYLKKNDKGFLINHDDDGNWRHVFYKGIRESGGREDVERDGSWDIVEGAVIRMMVELPLSRLGWLTVDDQEQISLLDDEDAEFAFEVIVQPNFEVMILGNPDPATLWQISRFSKPSPEERVKKYILDKKAFADALGRGHNKEDMVALLDELSRAPLPQNVRFSLDDWGELSERIRIWPDGFFIEAEGIEELQKTLGAKFLDTLSPQLLAGGHFVCPDPDAATLREVLPPRRKVLDYSRRLPPVVEPAQGLVLRAQYEDLHLRARQVLSSITRELSNDRFELDQIKVREAADALGVDRLRDSLKDILSRPLSSALSLALRTWAGEFDPVFAGMAEVLICDHPEQADLLDELPEFQPFLQRRLAKGVYLLKPDSTAETQELLRRIGIEPKDQA